MNQSMQTKLEEIRARHKRRKRQLWRADAERQRRRVDEEDWVTINGTHVLLNEEGEALSGGKLKGMAFKNAKSQKSSKSKAAPEKKKEPSTKSSARNKANGGGKGKFHVITNTDVESVEKMSPGMAFSFRGALGEATYAKCENGNFAPVDDDGVIVGSEMTEDEILGLLDMGAELGYQIRQKKFASVKTKGEVLVYSKEFHDITEHDVDFVKKMKAGETFEFDRPSGMETWGKSENGNYGPVKPSGGISEWYTEEEIVELLNDTIEEGNCQIREFR